MSEKSMIEKIVDYIEQNIDNELSLDEIARNLNYSKFYIARVFSEKTNCTVYKYIKNRRLTLAAQKLVFSQKPIIEIAYEAHYGSQQAFTLAFHQFYLCTPQVFRRNGLFHSKQTPLFSEKALVMRSCSTSYYGGQMAA